MKNKTFLSFYVNLSLKLELFTVFVPIPTYVYFIVILGSSGLLGSVQAIVIAGLVCGGYTVIWGIAIRYFRLKKIFDQIKLLEEGNLNEDRKRDLKLIILQYPFKESRTIIERWLAGGISGALLYFLITWEVIWSIPFTVTYGFLFTIPISYVFYGFISESEMRKLLNQYDFHSVEVEDSEAPFMGYFRRISLVLFAIVIIPTSIFGLFLIASVNNLFKVNNPGLSIGIVSFQALVAIAILTYVVGKSIKMGLSNANSVLEELGKGNFLVETSRISSDEFGKQGFLLRKVIYDLRKMYDEITDLNYNLEAKVEKRTKELSESLETISKLKFQQDGDYFLTTLLLKPLSYNRVISGKRIQIDTFTKQKKEFQFKNKTHEIGGDICIAQDIKLKNRNYTAFLNADAMGKSMQGAGGILVLGSVFQSILQRTTSYQDFSNVYPEMWLKATFKEMQKVFESFDGSMLISLTFGLVDDKSGMVFFINAEHPWTILLRDNKASFIENQMYFRKIGTTGIKGSIFISCFKMKPGDRLIMGSDGKDDLVLSNDSEKGRLINEDETLILNYIQKAEGNIQSVYNNIVEDYSLMDDFSLLSISYPHNEEDLDLKKEVQEVIKIARAYIRSGKESKAINTLESFYNLHKEEEIGKALVKLYIKTNQYNKACNLSRQFLRENESDSNLLFKISYCMKLNQHIEEAIELAERIKLREPENIRNLIHLADLYTYIKNSNKANKILRKILSLKPDNELALRIKKDIEI
ncbi:MAG: SpoIIE family protein phosphatase [Leptospiraceae bacterium]|nr:SpoIIE family protein phosphatase [Leptospiraceae bacterium]MCP5501057.1 SpoIIE family protein phosphatase [Leptospiraceae bacterium]